MIMTLLLILLIVFCVAGVFMLAFVGRLVWPEVRDLIHDFHWFGF